MFPGMLLGADLSSVWPAHTVDGEAFLHHILKVWYGDWELSLDVDNLKSLDETLTALSHAQQEHIVSTQVRDR